MKAADSSAGTQQYSWSHCSSSMHSAWMRARKASGDSLRPVFSLMRSTRPWATAFWMGTEWRDQCGGELNGLMGLIGLNGAEGAWSVGAWGASRREDSGEL